jgi:hypothetical protein
MQPYSSHPSSSHHGGSFQHHITHPLGPSHHGGGYSDSQPLAHPAGSHHHGGSLQHDGSQQLVPSHNGGGSLSTTPHCHSSRPARTTMVPPQHHGSHHIKQQHHGSQPSQHQQSASHHHLDSPAPPHRQIVAVPEHRHRSAFSVHSSPVPHGRVLSMTQPPAPPFCRIIIQCAVP